LNYRHLATQKNPVQLRQRIFLEENECAKIARFQEGKSLESPYLDNKFWQVAKTSIARFFEFIYFPLRPVAKFWLISSCAWMITSVAASPN
jgi:hypothetical protein